MFVDANTFENENVCVSQIENGKQANSGFKLYPDTFLHYEYDECTGQDGNSYCSPKLYEQTPSRSFDLSAGYHFGLIESGLLQLERMCIRGLLPDCRK